MKSPPLDAESRARLEARVPPLHLRRRLGIEADHEAQIFGQGRTFFHIENWYSIHGLIRGLLRLALLHGRGRRNLRRIRLHENRLSLPTLPPAFEGFRILHLSDLHLDMAADLVDVLIERVRGLEHDLCVVTGDLRARTFGRSDPALEAMRRLRPWLADEVLAVLGNHDSIRMVPALEDMGVQVLLNEHRIIRRADAAIYLAGIDDPHYYRVDNMERALAGIPAGALSILLAHSPEVYRHAAAVGVDVLFCGHTHGGQICLPGRVPVLCNARVPRSLCSGAWRHGNLQGYTSVGSGACVVDVRLNCPPEVTLHHLCRSDSPPQ